MKTARHTFLIFASVCAISLGCSLATSSLQAQTELRANDPLLDLVKQLGDDDFTIRKQAEEQLRVAGSDALDALRRGKVDVDNEIRMRSARLIQIIQREDYDRRIEKFLKSSDSANSFGLNGWEQYQAVVGNEPEDRQFFAIIHSNEGTLLSSLTAKRAWLQREFGERLNHCRQAIKLTESQDLINTVAAILLISTDESYREDGTISINQLEEFVGVLSDKNVRSQIADGAYQDQLQALLSAWFRSVPLDDGAFQQICIELTVDMKLVEFLPTVLAGLQETSVAPSLRVNSIRFIAEQGDGQYIKHLEALLDDNHPISPLKTTPALRNGSPNLQQPARYVQVRDVALAGCILLSKKSYNDFGFEVYEGPNEQFPPLEEAGFKTDEQRDAAIEKWRSNTTSD